jgi:hypothetical protein
MSLLHAVSSRLLDANVSLGAFVNDGLHTDGYGVDADRVVDAQFDTAEIRCKVM